MSAIHRKRSAIREQLRLAVRKQRALERAHAILATIPDSDRRTRMLEDLGAVIDAAEVDVNYLRSALSAVEGAIASGGEPPQGPNDPFALPKILSDT